MAEPLQTHFKYGCIMGPVREFQSFISMDDLMKSIKGYVEQFELTVADYIRVLMLLVKLIRLNQEANLKTCELCGEKAEKVLIAPVASQDLMNYSLCAVAITSSHACLFTPDYDLISVFELIGQEVHIW